MRRPRTVEEARQAVERAERAFAAARARSEAATPGGLVGYDPAILSGTTRKRSARRSARRFAAYDREAEAARALATARATLAEMVRRERRASVDEATKAAVTPETIAAATHIRTRLGWARVVRVNAKSVSVESGYSWVDRIPMTDILETAVIRD